MRHLDPSAKYFAVFDAVSGFHQIPLHPESSKLLNITTQMGNYRLGCAEMRRFEWNKAMEEEFLAVKHIFTHQIRLSPLDVDKKINIATYGANSSGIGFVIFQNEDDLNPGKNVKIIKANSSGLKDSQKLYSAVETELLALKFACESSFFYLYGSP